MKTKEKVFLALLILLSLSGCSKKNNTSLLEKDLSFLSKNKVSIYSYKKDVNNLDIEIVFNDYNDIKFDNDYTIIIIDNLYYQEINKEMLDYFESKLKSKNNVCCMFISFENLNFFEGTNFSNEKNFYPVSGDNVTYYNFGDNASRYSIKTFSFDTEEDIKNAMTIIKPACEIIKEDLGTK